jgi:hypothetical protein
MDSAGKGMNADEERSFFDAYREAGLYFRAAIKNRDLIGFDLINEVLKPTSFVAGNEQKLKPRLTPNGGGFVLRCSQTPARGRNERRRQLTVVVAVTG